VRSNEHQTENKETRVSVFAYFYEHQS